MPPVRLRGYQSEALAELRAQWSELKAAGKPQRLLLVSRTGTGKSVVAAALLASVVARGRRAAFVVRDRTLLAQTSAHMTRIGLVDQGVIAAGIEPNPTAPVQVCSAQTLTARGEAPPADVVVFDEAHGVLCATSRAIFEAYPDATILGLTATPERGDGQPLGDVFTGIVQVRATFEELVAMGALVPCDVIAPTAGKPTRSLAEHPIAALARHAPLGSGHKPVIFGAHCAHANELAEQARALGYRVAMVDGETADEARAEAFERFALPASDPAALDLLTNANLLTQGWDCPPADVGILARATTTWSMWMQIAGRFLRPSPATGKTRALLVDLRGSVFLHGLPSGDREFSLEVSETQRAKKDRLPSLTCCRSCGATYKSARVCPRCGAVLPPPRRPRIEREKLGAIAIVTSEMKKRAEYEQLLRLGRARGYKPKWAAHVFHAKHGHWPAWPIGKVA